MLLKDNLNNILMYFDLNFTNEGKIILKKAVSNERMINYNNLFFKVGDAIIQNFDFLKRFGTLHDLLIDLLNEEIGTYKAVKEQNEIITKIEGLKGFILLEEKSITNKNTQSIIRKTKTRTQKKIFFARQKSVLRNALKLYDKKY